MRKMRWGAAVLAALFLLSLLTGCSGSSAAVRLDPKNPVSLEIWHYYNGPQKTAFDELVTEFNDTVGREQGIVVEAFSQGSISELIEAVLAAANHEVGAGSIPAIFAAYADTAYQVDQLGLVASLDAYLTPEELSAYIPGYIEEGRLDAEGHLKIFPTAKSTEILMLNKTDWEPFAQEKGYTLEDLSTVEGVVRVAEAYYRWTDDKTEAPEDGKAFFGRDAMANYIIIGCKQLGVEIFHVENGQATFQLDRDVLKKLWDNYYLPTVNGYFGAFGKFRSDDVKTGDLLAFVGSTSGAAYFPEEVMVGDADSYPIEALAAPAPMFEGGEAYAVQQGAGMVVTKSDEKTEYAATVFLKWFTESQRNTAFSLSSGYLPVKGEASTLGNIEAAMQEADITGNLRLSLPVAVETTEHNAMYTNKAFQGGTDARNVLEYSLSDLAKADREAVVAAMADGATREEAVAPYVTDEHFDAWLMDLKARLEATAQ